MELLMNNSVSVVGNFICTNENRLDVLRNQIKSLSHIFDGCDFILGEDYDGDSFEHILDKHENP